MSLPVAREKAISAAHWVSQGIDPVAEKKRTKALSVTLRQVLDDYCADKTLKPGTTLDDHNAIRKSFSDWLDKPLTRISETMVRTRYLERGKKDAKLTTKERQWLQIEKEQNGDKSFWLNRTAMRTEITGSIG